MRRRVRATRDSGSGGPLPSGATRAELRVVGGNVPGGATLASGQAAELSGQSRLCVSPRALHAAPPDSLSSHSFLPRERGAGRAGLALKAPRV